ncbi:MAG TPA: hypothetical protein VLI04_01900 [Nocardioidaceae bacterium]|nr:hypothetical protein [Nocardioidaceae bacterium]
MPRTRLIALAALGVMGGMVGAVPPANSTSTAGPTLFTNAAAITIPDSGQATPYPSTIEVSGLTTAITDLDVVLTGYSHTCPFDVAVLVVAPSGQQSLLMADLGPGSGCPAATGANLTFDDAAAGPVPYPPTTGTWKPTDGQPATGNTFTAPAPGGDTHPTSLAAFNGLVGNGTWSVYALDENPGDTGAISGGWSLSITTAPDLDGDGVEDATDQCPSLQSFGGNGCPTRDRSLTLRAGSSPKRVVGRLYAAGYPALYGGRTVKIWKVRPGPDRKIATRVTFSPGTFRVRVANGRYYATSAALVVASAGQCTFDKSPVVRVR